MREIKRQDELPVATEQVNRMGARCASVAHFQRSLQAVIIMTSLLIGLVSSCLRTPSYYASLKTETYANGTDLNGKTQYGPLSLREDGACSITETRDGKDYRGGGSWSKTARDRIVSIGLSSNSAMTRYHFFARLNNDTNSYIVSDSVEKLIEQ